MTNRVGLCHILAMQFTADAVEKGFLSGKSVRSERIMMIAGGMFNMAAAIGHRFRANAEDVLTVWAGDAKSPKQLDELKGLGPRLAGGIPVAQSLSDVLWISDMQMMEPNRPMSDWRRWLAEMSKGKGRLLDAQFNVYMSGLKGLVFGTTFPDSVEQLWSNPADPANRESWAQAYKAGAVNSPTPPDLTLADKEQEAVLVLREFCAANYPELLLRLGL